MQRSEFVRKLLPLTLLNASFIFPKDEIQINELTGITKPTLYGSGFELRLEAANALMAMMQNTNSKGMSVR